MNTNALKTAFLTALFLWSMPLAVQGQFTCTTNFEHTIIITGYTGPGGVVTIPSRIGGLPVSTIGYRAFFECHTLRSVTLPDSLTDIVFEAFFDCTSLTNITIPESVTDIGEAAFGQCTSLTLVVIPNGVRNIFEGAFAYCTSLTSITIPESVTYIEGPPFYGCANLAAIMVDPLNPNYSSGDGVLFSKNPTRLLECPGAKAGTYTVPDSVTTMDVAAFSYCSRLTSVRMGSSITSIPDVAFYGCCSMTNVTIPNSVTNIGNAAFSFCTNLTSVTIPDGVTSIGHWAFIGCSKLVSVIIPSGVTTLEDSTFQNCLSLRAVYFLGNAPSLRIYVFAADDATVYYLPGTTGWGTTFGGLPTALWVAVPTIQTPPQTQTAEAGSEVNLCVAGSSPLPLFYLWYGNATNLIRCSTNSNLELTNVQFFQSGAYTVVLSNALGALTSPPAMLQVIAPVERRPVPGVLVRGQGGNLLNLDCTDSLNATPNWTTLGSVSLAGTSQYYFDLTLPLPLQRFYRAWQSGLPAVIPSLSLLGIVPAITLTGGMGGSVRVDGINQFGPTNAWFTLDTVTLTNTSQFCFDTSAWGQPPRLYRLVQVP